MLRREKEFPLNNLGELCGFLKTAWEDGWLDEYAEEHFLIRAIENRLSSFVGKEQLINNDLNLQGIIGLDKSVNMNAFNGDFCVNFSNRLQLLSESFGEENIKRFMTDQMSAGKAKYREDAFFEALSELSILSFYAGRCSWMKMFYEPPVAGSNTKNPEAKFVGPISCKIDEIETDREITINIEVKSPEFPHDCHEDEKIVIPTMLLTDEGRKEVRKFCDDYDIVYLSPRVLKLRDFINSAASKFAIPQDNEFNLLYINWSYRDFPSNSFLEAWALLTNETNGILTHPEIALSMGVLAEAFEKITAVIVYTESIEGLMFSDFRHVWQRTGVGPRFRMWVLDEKLRDAEWNDKSNVLFSITGMNPDKISNQRLMIDCKSKTFEEMCSEAKMVFELSELINATALQG